MRQLATQRGVDLTEAIRLAVKSELSRSKGIQQGRLRRMRAIADHVATLPVRDVRTDEEILGYDERGLPS
ncbi:MAG: type II toxin-antitoxin system VapB family antitoxin [Candidatus Eremiobacteraeota bacterium]|nr:type II toxin-antitoxin system VapB family antitoxin [Candidatus Eremiobacteraeota bacterium]